MSLTAAATRVLVTVGLAALAAVVGVPALTRRRAGADLDIRAVIGFAAFGGLSALTTARPKDRQRSP